jgi:hypothetical protein
MTLISLLLAINTWVVFAIIVGIIIVIIIFSTRKREEANEQSTIDLQKEVPMSPEAYGMYILAREMTFDGKLDDAIFVFKKVLELEPDSWSAAMMLGNLVFEKDRELSFECLKIMEQHFIDEGANFNDPALKDLGLYFYMLGYHYNRYNFTDKAIMFRNIAMNSRSFVKDFKGFRNKFPY